MRRYGKSRLRAAGRGAAGFAALSSVACVLAACGGSNSSGTDTGATGDTTIAGKKVAVVFPAQPSLAPLFSMACGAQQEGDRLGLDMLEPQGPKQPFDLAGVTQIVQSLAATNPDGLLYFPPDPKAGAVPVKAPSWSEVPIVNIGTELSDPALAISFIATDQVADAERLGELLADQIGDSGKVAVIGTLPDNSITIDRVQGFEDAIARHPEIDIVSRSYPPFDVSKFAAEATALLTKHPDLKGIYATNDTIATGVATAIRQAGKVGQVKLITWDLQPGVLKMLHEGVVTGTIAQQSRLVGKLAIEQLARQLAGKSVQRRIEPVDELTVTPDTVDSPEVREFIRENYSTTSC